MVRWTLAHVFALGVYAGTILTGLRIFTLVNVRTVSARTVQFVALVALAAEHTEYVLAAAEHAQVAEHFALVDVHTRLVVVLVGVHKPHLTFAAERARVVETVTILAECVVVSTLVDVLAVVAITPEASVTDTLKHTRIVSP